VEIDTGEDTMCPDVGLDLSKRGQWLSIQPEPSELENNGATTSTEDPGGEGKGRFPERDPDMVFQPSPP
jgi:hypothetical protein